MASPAHLHSILWVSSQLKIKLISLRLIITTLPPSSSNLSSAEELIAIRSPKPFIFGVATASYQIEGAYDKEGRGPSVWDEFTHRDPSPIVDKSTGDVAADSYHNMERDLQLLSQLGVQAYRFSISWSRILPQGDATQINELGVQYYNKLINHLLDLNITPFVTLFHWDTPLALQQKFGGFTNRLIVDYFEDYARVLFQRFGDRVKNWITFNEPNEFCGSGYGSAQSAPAVNFKGYGDYLCMHNVILGHARVYRMYEREFKSGQKGEIGITLNNRFAFPEEEGDPNDSVNRFMTFTLGWKMDPLFDQPFHGYPEEMKLQIAENSKSEGRSRSRLPEFSAKDQELFTSKVVDFLGLNYYTSRIVSPGKYSPDASASYEKDLNVTLSINSEWIRAKSTWLYSVPEGLYRLLMWIKDRYQGPKIYITENGWSDEGELRDIDRVNYLQDHLKSIQRAAVEGVDVRGYFHWSLIDNFEWERGYT